MTRQFLETQGFTGFKPLRSIARGAPEVPAGPGAYAVIRPTESEPSFRRASVGGHFKGRDPSVAEGVLRAKWVGSTEVLYFGKAKSLSSRLDQFARFGRGEPVGHWGGRYLWQHEQCDQFLVGWAEDPDPAGREAEAIDAFLETHGVLPFANLNRPRGTVKR